MKRKYTNYILANGKRYIPAILPVDLRKGEMHRCFDNCAIVICTNRNYRYVEGFGIHPVTKYPIHHAWVTDGKHAFDVTWRAKDDEGNERPLPFTYIGIEIATEDVLEFMRTTGYQAIFENEWRMPGFINKIIKK